MFNNKLNYSLLGGIAVGLLATFGFAPEANAQELIRSNITPRSVNETNPTIDPNNIRSNVIAPGIRSNLTVIANDLNTTFDELLSDDTIGQIALSPSGAEVIADLQAADGITVDQGNVQQVEQQVPRVDAAGGVLSVEPTQPASVPEVLRVIED